MKQKNITLSKVGILRISALLKVGILMGSTLSANWTVDSGEIEELGDGYYFLKGSESSGGLAQQEVASGDVLKVSPNFSEEWETGALVQVNDLGLFFTTEAGSGVGEIYFRYGSWADDRFEVLSQKVSLDSNGYPLEWLTMEFQEGLRPGIMVLQLFGEAEFPFQLNEEKEAWAYLEPGPVLGIGLSDLVKRKGEVLPESSLHTVADSDVVFRVSPELVAKIPQLLPAGMNDLPDFTKAPIDKPEASFLKELYFKDRPVKSVTARRSSLIVPNTSGLRE